MTYDPKQIVFTDCQTTGLDIFNHEVWEMAFMLYPAANITIQIPDFALELPEALRRCLVNELAFVAHELVKPLVQRTHS